MEPESFKKTNKKWVYDYQEVPDLPHKLVKKSTSNSELWAAVKNLLISLLWSTLNSILKTLQHAPHYCFKLGLGIESKKSIITIFRKIEKIDLFQPNFSIRKIDPKMYIFGLFMSNSNIFKTILSSFCYNGISKPKTILHSGKKLLFFILRKIIPKLY